MRPSTVLVVCLFFPGVVAAQTKPADSPALEGILGELHQLRQDLRTLVGTAQRAQILASRVQAQEALIIRMQDRVDNARSTLTQLRSEEKTLTAEAKHSEDLLSQTDDLKTRKVLEDTIARFKASLEAQATTEQEIQAKLTDSEERLRLEQAKLGRLQDELDRLDKTLEQLSRP